MQRTPEEEGILRLEIFALNSKDRQEHEDQTLGLPTDPVRLEARTMRIANNERDLAEVKRFREEASQRRCDEAPEKIPASLIENPIAQRVLTETFVVNRLAEIRQFVGVAKLENFRNGFVRFTREAEVARIFGRFQRENG